MDLNYKIVYTESAVNDLDKILTYLSNYGNPMILTNFKNEINHKLDTIKLFPESNAVVFSQHDYNYRKMIIRSYIFVYYVDELNHEINIFRIFHELEDYQNKLGYK